MAKLKPGHRLPLSVEDKGVKYIIPYFIRKLERFEKNFATKGSPTRPPAERLELQVIDMGT
jgi:hypothetical protein